MALRRARENERRGQKSTLLIVGLANPGDEFEGSRHNIGGDAVRLVVARRGGTFSHERRQRATSVTLTTSRGPMTLAVPTTFMNESGSALPSLLRRTSIDDLADLVVVHDELDLEPGRLQLKLRRGTGGSQRAALDRPDARYPELRATSRRSRQTAEQGTRCRLRAATRRRQAARGGRGGRGACGRRHRDRHGLRL